MRITARDMALWASGEIDARDGDTVADGISFDTRTLSPGQAFVAVRGDRDGHDHLDRARAAGAPVLLVERGLAVPGVPCVQVGDTVAALGAIAHHCGLTDDREQDVQATCFKVRQERLEAMDS